MKVKLSVFCLLSLLSPAGYAWLVFPDHGPLDGDYALYEDTHLGQSPYDSQYKVTGATSIYANEGSNEYDLDYVGTVDRVIGAPVFLVDAPKGSLFEINFAHLNFSYVHSTSGNGGVISNAQNLLFYSCDNAVFSHNQTVGMGGAIYSSGDFIIEYGKGISFLYNKALGAQGNGGAIAIGSNSQHLSTTVDGSILFVHNEASHKGGAIYSESNVIMMYNKDIHFINNQAGELGGAIYVEGGFTFAANNGNVIFAGNTLSDGTRQAIYQSGSDHYNLLYAPKGSNIIFYDANVFESTTGIAYPESSGNGVVEFTGATCYLPGSSQPISGIGDRAVTLFQKNLVLGGGTLKISHNAKIRVAQTLSSYNGSILHFDLNGTDTEAAAALTMGSYNQNGTEKLTIRCTGGDSNGTYNLIYFADDSGIDLSSFNLEKTEKSKYVWDPETKILSLELFGIPDKKRTFSQASLAVVSSSLWTASSVMDNVLCGIIQVDSIPLINRLAVSERTHLWANYLGNYQTIQDKGDQLGVKSSVYGGVVGASVAFSSSFTGGFAFAQTWGKNTYIDATRSDQNMSIFTLYGNMKLLEKDKHALSLNLIGAYGYARNRSKLNEGSGSWDSNHFALQTQLIYSYQMARQWTISPYVGLEWQYGQSQNWDLDSRAGFRQTSVNFIRPELGAYVTYQIQSQWSMCANISVKADVQRKNPDGVGWIDDTYARLYCNNPGRVQMSADIGTSYSFNQRWSMYAGYGVEVAAQSTSQSFRIGTSYSF